MAGVGVYSSFSAIMTSTLFAASTSSALAAAGTESACVSMPRNSGPSIPVCLRYLQMASVIATTCHSLKLLSSEFRARIQLSFDLTRYSALDVGYDFTRWHATFVSSSILGQTGQALVLENREHAMTMGVRWKL